MSDKIYKKYVSISIRHEDPIGKYMIPFWEIRRFTLGKIEV